MNLTTDRSDGGVTILRVAEPRLVYPLLPQLTEAVSGLLADGETKLVLDLSQVLYLDSAAIGCLMDIYRQTERAGGALKLCNLQRRVATMLTMTGTQNLIELHPDTASAVRSFVD